MKKRAVATDRRSINSAPLGQPNTSLAPQSSVSAMTDVSIHKKDFFAQLAAKRQLASACRERNVSEEVENYLSDPSANLSKVLVLAILLKSIVNNPVSK